MLKKYADKKTNLKILEIGSGKKSYRKLFKNCDFLSTDIKKIPGVDETADVTHLKYKTNRFDIVLCLSVLDDIFDFNRAISEIHRVLRPSGQAVIYTPFAYPLHDTPHDYWRFTEHALKKIFSEFKKIDINPLIITKLHRKIPLGYFCVLEK